jgi:poly [ADP-ribose] polymerase
VEAISDSYYTIIPHSFGRQRPPIITTNEALQREVTLLESLGDMEIATTIMKDGQGDTGMHALDRQFAGLGLQEMTPRIACYS